MKNRFEVRPDGAVEVRLQWGLVMLIDESDLPRVAALPGTWAARRMKGRTYAVMRFSTSGRRVTFLAHRFLAATRAGVERRLEVDHVNGDGLDNRRSNLREVPHARNMLNRRRAAKHSRTGFLGASLDHRRGKYLSRVTVDGARHSLGYFDTTDQAAAARRRFLAEHRLAKK